ncbi:MAG: hypothetical protein QGI75_00980 [Phycisphaerales bacterium]|jgi:hypothetical protein|nr:hypothetical protein [Phycisphaerales bacterium]MDP6889905.1 hypothetical protein [Phycisphaerales bacterium]
MGRDTSEQVAHSGATPQSTTATVPLRWAISLSCQASSGMKEMSQEGLAVSMTA